MPDASSRSDLVQRAKAGLSERLTAFGKFRHTVIPEQNRYRFLLAGVVASLVAITILPDSNAEAETRSVEAEIPLVPQVDLTRFDLALETPVEMRVASVTLKSGDNLGPLLQRNGLSGQEAYRVTQAFGDVFQPRNLRAGQTFHLYFQGDTLDHMTFKPNVDSTVFVSRTGEDYTARKVEAEFKFETVSLAATVENSLYVDAMRLGAPDKTIVQFANIYEYSVDFQRDIQPGDQFEMYFEVARDHNGEIVKAGDLLYTSFSPRGKQSEYWLYQDSQGRENFYDAEGKTAKRKLRATPINGARLSSSYGRRKHPILGYRKMHAGGDCAAPSGTPILAAGSGTVERANRYGSFGNYIRIRHTDGYKTAYAHLKGFARGVKAGAYVKQDQVIGYVGTTGRSTGPHLHYEVHHHGKKINPRRLSQLAGKPLAASEKAPFAARRAAIDAARAAAPVIKPEPALEASAATPPSALPR